MIETNYKRKVKLAIENSPKNIAPVIEKELLHYEILKFLSENKFLDKLVFMGGTCLRP